MADPENPNTGGAPPAANGDDALASAAELEKVVEAKAKHKEEEQRKLEREAEAREKAEVEALRRSVTFSERETKELVRKFRAAAERGETEYVISTFPAKLLEDRGRAINNVEPDWPETLQGAPRGYYEAWETYLKDKGYRLSARVSRFNEDGLIEDIDLVIAW